MYKVIMYEVWSMRIKIYRKTITATEIIEIRKRKLITVKKRKKNKENYREQKINEIKRERKRDGYLHERILL